MIEKRAVLARDEQGICPTAVPEEQLVGRRIDGFWCVLGRVGMQLFAYREICPGCGSSLVQSPVTAGVVTCSICGRRYDLTRGGRSLDMEGRGMQAVPLVGEHSVGDAEEIDRGRPGLQPRRRALSARGW